MQGDIETYLSEGWWMNRAEGEPLHISEHRTKQGAVEAGQALAQARRVGHVVWNDDTTLGERTSYVDGAFDPHG